MDENTKKQLLEALKLIDVKDLYASEDEDKRKWFRFGAYDALRMASEVIIAWPERQNPEEDSASRVRQRA